MFTRGCNTIRTKVRSHKGGLIVCVKKAVLGLALLYYRHPRTRKPPAADLVLFAVFVF